MNLDSFEGHTPGPWTIELGNMEEYGETDTVMSSEGEVAMNVMRQDVALLADAPLLLAEVKRLRDHIRRMRHWAEPKMHEVHHDAWRKLHEEIYEWGEEE